MSFEGTLLNRTPALLYWPRPTTRQLSVLPRVTTFQRSQARLFRTDMAEVDA